LADLYGTLHSAAFSDSVDYSNDVDADADRAHALNLSRSLAEVKIVGTDMVRQLADTVTSRILLFKALAIEGGAKSVSLDTSDMLNEYLYMLERLMANDLGIPVSTKLEESDSVINVMSEASAILEHKRYLRQRVNDAMKKVNRED
jgi:anion-transporting  ArsA/GET3 family ATPase